MRPVESSGVMVSGEDKTTIRRIKVQTKSMAVIVEKIADNHPNTNPPVSRVRQQRNLLTVGNLTPIVTFFTHSS
jgi:hypothetical protein